MEEGDTKLPARRDAPGPAATVRLRDAEATAILRRASRRALRGDLPDPHDLTLQDLVEVAEEVGLDGGDVRRAAAVQPSAEPAAQRLIFGAPTGRSVKAWSPLPLPEERGVLAQAAGSVLGRDGDEVDSKEGRWTWETRGGLAHTRVMLRGDGDGTAVEVHGNRAPALALTYLPLLLGLGAISGSLGLFGAVAAGAGPLVAILGLFGLPLLLARPIFRRLSARSGEDLEQLAMEILRVLEDEAGG